MIAVQTKAVATPAKKNTPFFNKASEQSFFHSSVNESPFFSKSPGHSIGIQAKLNIGPPGDIYEKEADAMADKVVQRLSEPAAIQTKSFSSQNIISPFVQKKCAHCEEEEKLQKKEEDTIKAQIQRKPVFESNAEELPDDHKNIQKKCAECEKEEKLQKKEKEDESDLLKSTLQKKLFFENNIHGEAIQKKCAECEKEEKLQKKSDNSSQTASPGIESRLSSSKGSGSSLPTATRSQMENSFGADFSNVRIHNDSSSVQLSKDLNAQAFTHGSDIYFNSGKYDATSTSGRHLIAHELTHTIQQKSSSPGLARKNNIQLLCDHSKCAADFLTPSCPKPVDFLLNNKLHDIRYSVFISTANPVVLVKGDTGDAVVMIKKLILNTHCSGYDRTAVEAEPEQHFGRDTKDAVKYFQLQHKDTNGDPLIRDGRVGPATLGAMDIEIGLSPVPLPKAAEGKGRCFGVAKQGPGLKKEWDVSSAGYLKIPPFFPAVQAWEISNFDIAKFFLKTEHRDFLRTKVVPQIKDIVSKSKTKLSVQVIGEASTTASDAFNLQLSFNRAMCLLGALKEFGLDSAMIESPVTALGESLAKFMPMLRGETLFPVDEVEDLSERRVTIVLKGPAKPDCDKTKASTEFYAYVACRTPHSYLINIMDLSDPAKPMYREFNWWHDDEMKGCDFKPGFGPRSVFKITATAAPLRLAKKDPDNFLAETDFQGPTFHYYDDRGMTIEKAGVLPAYVLPVPGDWDPMHCEKQHEVFDGELNPIGPVICGMMPLPPASDKCKTEEDCPPAKRQRPAKKFTARMKWISADIIKILKKINWVKKVTKKVDDFLNFFGIDINTSVTAAYLHIGTADDKNNPITRKFYFIGGEITGSSVPIIDVSSVYAEDFTIDDPKQLETVSGDSDFGGFADLTIKGGTNKQELKIKGIDKPIVFKGRFCETGSDNKVTGYLKNGEISCSLLEAISRGDKTCKEEKEDCSDSQKLKEDDKFSIKTGRATIADLPVAGKKLADKLGCGVTAAFINIGTVDADEKERIYRKFIFVGKNHDCGFNVKKGNWQEDFLLSRALTYPDPNDTFALSDFSGIAKLDKDGKLLIISPQNFPINIKLPGLFDGPCPKANAEGLVIPISAVECGAVPDPSHSTIPDVTDLNRCEDFKKKNLVLITSALSDLKGRYSKVVSDITDAPRLIYPLYNDLFYKIGKSLTNAVFFGKTFDQQKVITVVDMEVVSVYPDATYGYVFTVKFLSDPCSYNESGEPIFVLPKDCKEAYITVQGDYFIYPLPEIDSPTRDQKPDTTNDKEKIETPHETEKCHADCHALGIIPGQLTVPPKIKIDSLGPASKECAGCHQGEIQKKEVGDNGSDRIFQTKPFSEMGGESSEDKHIQRKCAACEQEEKLQKKVTPTGEKKIRKCEKCEKEEKLQKKASSSNSVDETTDIENTLNATQGSGNSMSASHRGQMESSFGTNFSGVKIHNDSTAVKMNESLNAQAFTHGNDIYFNKGKYNPENREGKFLLAHELTHVVQQNGRKDIQKKGETASSSNLLQLTPGDEHDLTSAQLSGDALLEKTFDNETTVGKFSNSKGEHVRRIQQALLQLGIGLPLFGADGQFGGETETAAKEFQQKADMSIGEQDGIVGRKTIALLDRSLRNNSISTDTDQAENDFTVKDEKKDDACKGKPTDQACPDPNSEVTTAADEAIQIIEKVEKEQLPPIKNKKADYPQIFDTIFRNNDTRDISFKVTEVRAIYDKIKDFIGTLKTNKKLVRCATDCDGGCRSGSPAYHTNTKATGHVITFCPDFNKNKERILIVIHESHHAAIPGSGDKAYASTRLFEKLDHTKALLNAASFHVYAAWVDTPGSQPIGPEIKDTNLINDTTQKANVDMSLAFMHQWFRLVPFDVSETVQGTEEAKEKGKYLRHNAEVFMREVFSKWFGLTPPPGVPNSTDIKKLRAIEEHIKLMENAFKAPFVILETKDQSFWSTGPGSDIALNNNVLKLDRDHMIIALLQELIHATPNISAETEPLYTGTINDIRNLRGLDP